MKAAFSVIPVHFYYINADSGFHQWLDVINYSYSCDSLPVFTLNANNARRRRALKQQLAVKSAFHIISCIKYGKRSVCWSCSCQGNAYFKEGKYEAAVECYSQGMEADGMNILLPANRAMAFLKLQRSAPA